jgi:hypothetical protein
VGWRRVAQGGGAFNDFNYLVRGGAGWRKTSLGSPDTPSLVAFAAILLSDDLWFVALH